jgi:hypothetical protein
MAEVEMARSERISKFLFGYTSYEEYQMATKRKSFEARSKFDGALNSNTAFLNLIRRQANDIDIERIAKSYSVVSNARRTLDRYHANWVYRGCKGQVYSLSDISSSEDIFFREDVSIEESLKVPRIPIKGTLMKRTLETVSRVGLYQISQTMYAWAESKYEELKSQLMSTPRPLPREYVFSVFCKNREWVNDDSLLIAKALRMTELKKKGHPIVLISQDAKLARRISASTGSLVGLCNPESILPLLKGIDQSTEITAWQLQPFFENIAYDTIVLSDIGSISYVASQHTEVRGVFKKTKCISVNNQLRETTNELRSSYKRSPIRWYKTSDKSLNKVRPEYPDSYTSASSEDRSREQSYYSDEPQI